MNAEALEDVNGRAAKHAALADPTRLAMVDLLSFGDRTSTELGTLLALPSNLVAHHLGVLEGEGIVIRTASEADRRRHYVHLVAAAVAGIYVARTRAVSRVLFVCTANSARSQLATALWNRASEIPAASAGTHPAPEIAAGAVTVAYRHGLPLAAAVPRALAEVLSDTDFVVTVCDNAHEELADFGDLHWSIPDPVRLDSPASFETAYDELTRRVNQLSRQLVPLHEIGSSS